MFQSFVVNSIIESLYKDILRPLNSIQELNFRIASTELSDIKKIITAEKSNRDTDAPDEVLNDFFILNEIILLIDDYINYWHILTKNKFADSWLKLQDVQTRLRIIYRFTFVPRPDFFNLIERQCGELEKLYPYNVFFSIGTTIEEEECSICGKAVNSFNCYHIKGELYRGNLSYGIVKKVSGLDHVAMVDNPKDKRCVVSFEDSAEQFSLVRYLSDLINEKKLMPLNFSHLEFKKIKVQRKDIPKVSRNNQCICGSGRKYKKCCHDKEVIERDHVDIIEKKIIIEDLLPNNALELNACHRTLF